MLHGKQFTVTFVRWHDDGTLLDIFEILNSTSDMKILCIDSTLVKVYQHSSGAKKSKASQDRW